MKNAMKRNLLIGFSISLIILIISSVASFTSIRNLLNSAKLVDHTNEVVLKLEQVLSSMKDAETGQRGYLLTGMDEFLEPYIGSYEKTIGLIYNLQSSTSDNLEQQKNIQQLHDLVKKRFSRLQVLIDRKRAGTGIDINDLKYGKIFMDSVRSIVNEMETREKVLLISRTNDLRSFSSYAPILIVFAAIAAIIITIMFYVKMSKDIDVRARLEKELLDKDAAISRRLGIIQSVSSRISGGDYTIRVEDNQSDNIGDISKSLNDMAVSLQHAFEKLSEKEWLQTGAAGLSNAILGSERMSELSEKLLSFIARYSNSQVGALYTAAHENVLRLEQTYGVSRERVHEQVIAGEGVAGQCFQLRQTMQLSGITDDRFHISFSAGELKPVSIIAFPLTYEGSVTGVIELGSIHGYGAREMQLFENIGENIGIAINTIHNRQRLQELLEETQSQSEELMAQQSELEQINAELEEQSQQLQSSEEELKVQSEELIETNTLLEERSAALEQKNQLILQKNAEIEKKAEDLALSTKYKSEFLANMSHELRTPLNSILLLSRLMSENNEQNLTEEQVQYATVIQSSGNGLLQLIDEILDLSKIESGKMSVEYEKVKVADITNGLTALFEPLAKQQQLEWRVETGADVPESIVTDRLRLEQILKNLLSNAFKFTSKGSVQLILHCTALADHICFTVKDTGIGISPEKQELIFEAFQQEDGSTRRKYGGTGLGLSISRELAKLLGGMITVSSTPSKGSQFVCCIPVNSFPGAVGMHRDMLQQPVALIGPASPLPVADEDRYHTSTIPGDVADDRETITAADKVILVIEDDVNFASFLVEYARQKGYKVLVAVRGDKGIELAVKYMPAGILLDIQLPVKNGWEVMEALRKNSHTKHIPVHVMSSFEVKKESLEQGALDFINKPIAPEQLNTIFEKIDFILGRKGKKVLIIEENNKHAKALAYYLNTYKVNTEIQQSVEGSVQALYKETVNCVILDMNISDKNADALLGTIRKNEGLEELPIILFTGKSLSQPEEFKLKKYADAIVMKTANSYQRILDEVSLFLHLMQDNESKKGVPDFEKMILQENVLKGKNVLLADDDVRNIYSMTKALEKYDVHVIPAMDGNEALELIKVKPVDVVLMDMMMPNMDGYQSIRAIRAIPALKNIPVIAVTAKAMSGDREKCIAAGASDYISKPVDMDQLISLLRIWLYEKGY